MFSFDLNADLTCSSQESCAWFKPPTISGSKSIESSYAASKFDGERKSKSERGNMVRIISAMISQVISELASAAGIATDTLCERAQPPYIRFACPGYAVDCITRNKF